MFLFHGVIGRTAQTAEERADAAQVCRVRRVEMYSQ